MKIVEARCDDAVEEKAASSPGPTICLISFSAIADDPRVRRQGDAFSGAGWKVCAVGLPGARSTPPAWTILTYDDLKPVQPVEELAALPSSSTPDEAADELIPRDTSSPLGGQAQSGVQKTEPDTDDPKPAQPIETLAELSAAKTPNGAADKSIAQDTSSVLDGGIRQEAENCEPNTSATALTIDRLRIRRIYQRILPAPLRARLYTLRTLRYKLKSQRRAQLASLNAIGTTTVRSVPVRSVPVLSVPTWLIHARARAVFALNVGRRRIRLLRSYVRQFLMRMNQDDGPDFYLDVPEVRRLYDVSRLVKADIYLANDWHTLPIAMRAARETGGHFGYDTHEYALEEYRYRLSWRLFRRPLARWVERVGLREALVASTVSQGIAEDIAREYGLPEPLLVIRNTPDRQEVEARPCTGNIKVLFHGLIAGDRGLEDCISSVAFWRPEFKFCLRGPVSPEYRAKLGAIAKESGVTDRVEFLAPVPMVDLVRRAAEADIGISTPPKTSKHNVYALPNKFFEYIQAGLAIAVADLPDMGRIVKHYELGRLIPEVTPESIAETINAFTVDSVSRYKQNSLKAAGELNWQVEQQRLVGAYTDALTRVCETATAQE